MATPPVLGDRRIRELSAAWWHFIGNLVLVVIEAINWIIRYQGGDSAVLPGGVALSFIAVGLMLFIGWRGWEMVYRHRVRIADIAEAIDATRAANVSGLSNHAA